MTECLGLISIFPASLLLHSLRASISLPAVPRSLSGSVNLATHDPVSLLVLSFGAITSSPTRTLAEVVDHGCAHGNPPRNTLDSGSNAIQSRLDTLVANPDLAPLLSLVKGVRNGVVYGSKVRFPHALV
jgi:hypothetical protein